MFKIINKHKKQPKQNLDNKKMNKKNNNNLKRFMYRNLKIKRNK